MTYDYLIVGAGFSGCVLAERIASQLDKTVLLIDRRDHLAGNAHDYTDDAGVLVHRYGPHAFHTNARSVWEYLSRFTEWHPYEHKVKAKIGDNIIPVPFNLNSLKIAFGDQAAQNYAKALISAYGYGSSVPILKLREHHESLLREVAEFVYRNIYLGYTVKQWGLDPQELDPSVTSRVPVEISYDDRYFHDAFQAMPAAGYSEMFARMTAHPNIRVSLNSPYRDVLTQVQHKKLIYTGPVDEFFDFVHGRLPYRSLRFAMASHGREFVQDVAQVNYPNDYEYTRTTEFKHMTGQQHAKTSIATEYPQAHRHGVNDPYYPIRRPENDAMYELYAAEAERSASSVLFVGRLAEYKYYNMDQIVARALRVFEERVLGRP